MLNGRPVRHPGESLLSLIIWCTQYSLLQMMSLLNGELLANFHDIDRGTSSKLDVLGHDSPTMIRKLQDLSGIDPNEGYG